MRSRQKGTLLEKGNIGKSENPQCQLTRLLYTIKKQMSSDFYKKIENIFINFWVKQKPPNI